MEDFGYSKEREENYMGSLVKRAFLIGASLFSLACFGYITVSAYYFFSQDSSQIKVIEAEVDPIKIVENSANQSEEGSIKIDSSIYEDIFGTRKRNKEVKIREVVQPAAPPRQENVVKIETVSTVSQTAIEPQKDEKKSVGSEKIIVYSQDDIKGNGSLLATSQDKKPSSSKQVSKTSNKKYVRVQIAAMTSKPNAYQYFEGLKKQYPSLFSDLNDYIQEVDLGKRGIFYRVQVDNFYDQIRAESFCKKYIAQTQKSKSDCIIVE